MLKKRWLLPTIITIVILAAGGLYIGSILTKEDSLSDSDIRTQLENRYGGQVDQLSLEGNIYFAEMTRNGTTYSAEVDALSGKVLSLIQTGELKKESPKILSEKEAREVIAQKYPGEIERISLNESQEIPVYEAEIAKEQELILVTVDALAGEITSETVKETSVENAHITREEAIKIALGELKGEVEYITFEQTEDGGFYLVEIEQDNEEESDLEAVFKIHAISGKIMGVTWND